MNEGDRLCTELVQHAPVGLIVLREEVSKGGRNFRIISLNPAMLDLSYVRGAKMEDLIGKTIADVFPAACDKELAASFAAVVRSRQPRHLGELHFGDSPAPDGVVSVQAFPLPDGCVGIALENVTERKRSEEVLRANEAKYRAFLDLAPDGVVISDEEGRIVLVNSQTERLFGWSRADMLQQPVEILLPERLRAQHVIHRKEYSKSPRTRPMGTGLELVGLRADGTEFPVEISLSAVHTQDGLLTYSAIRDITERKRADDLLKQTTAQLERSNAELEQFAYAASHDLQEPLRTIVGATQLLARDYKDKLDPEAVQWLDFASAGAKRMQALINAILDYARLGVPRKPLGQVDCQIAYQAAVENLQPAIKEAGAELASGPLPVVIGDSQQIIQLFQNLIANAIKFSAQGRPRIVVSVEEHENEWRIAIKDNGIGIDPKNFGRLFNLFQRLHAHDQYEGTGIGLAICKKIVERHGGRIWVESVLGQGSTFYFTIPKPRVDFEPGSAP